MESRAIFLRIKEEQKLEREMNGYMNWICRAGMEETLGSMDKQFRSICMHTVCVMCDVCM